MSTACLCLSRTLSCVSSDSPAASKDSQNYFNKRQNYIVTARYSIGSRGLSLARLASPWSRMGTTVWSRYWRVGRFARSCLSFLAPTPTSGSALSTVSLALLTACCLSLSETDILSADPAGWSESSHHNLTHNTSQSGEEK